MPSFADKHYVPFLKGKAGEFKALSQLAATDHARLTPLIEIWPRDIHWRTEKPTETTSEALDGDAERIRDAWGGDDEIFIDLGAFDPGDRLDSGDHPVEGFFDDARSIGLLAIPVTGLDRDGAYHAAVRRVAASDGRGAAIRLTMDFADDIGQLGQGLEGVGAELGLNPSELDLLVDLGEVTATGADRLETRAEALLRDLPYLNGWRTLTLASGAFPGSPASVVSPVSKGSISRRDWKLWGNLRAKATPLPRLPAYGDYAIAHPEFLMFDPSKMTMTAGIRYAAPNDWLVVRGRAIKGRGGGQFHGLAAQIVRDAAYRGPGHCQGCEFIDQCSKRQAGPGSATTWRTVGTRHHLAQVDEQIASLP